MGSGAEVAVAARKDPAAFLEDPRRVLLLTWVIAAIYTLPFVRRGWVPHDEGILGEMAELVLRGKTPYVDFGEIYTGGLTYWNALAFRLFGISSMSLRILLFLSFLAFVPAVYAIASRFARPVVAGLVTLFAVTWSVPNYFAAIPSWYNLFLGTWAGWAILRHVETGRRRWLLVAGLFAGASCLFKVIGAHMVAAFLLFLLYRERHLSSGESAHDGTGGVPRPVTPFLLFEAAGLATYLAVLFFSIRARLGPGEMLYFFFPSVCVCALLLWTEAAIPPRGVAFGRRVMRLLRLAAPLVAGTLLPIGLFLLPFVLRGQVHRIFGGVVSSTGAHVEFVRMLLPPVSTFWYAVPCMLVLAAGPIPRLPGARILGPLAVGAAIYILAKTESEPVYRAVWYSIRWLGVAVVVAACVRLGRADRLGAWSSETRQKVFLLTAIVAVTGLVQYPFAAPIYFFYFAPWIVLAAFALVASDPRSSARFHITVLVLYLVFTVYRLNSGYIWALGKRYISWDPPHRLAPARSGGLLVHVWDASPYGALIPLVQEKSGGRPIYAGPNAFQVNFLSGLGDVLMADGGILDPVSQSDTFFRRLEAAGTRVVVLNHDPSFASEISGEVLARLERMFPEHRDIGRFTVRWKP